MTDVVFPRASLLVFATAPVRGWHRTRLCPPFTPDQVAVLARRALQDTLGAALRSAAGRRVLVLDGEPGPWLPPGFEIIPQRGDGSADRLAAAFADVAEPAFLVGTHSPQVTPELLDAGLAAVAGGDAAFGGTGNGGYWGIGLHRPEPDVFLGMPMSLRQTGAMQRARLAALGLETVTLPLLRGVYGFSDALEVAEQAPSGRFAAAIADLTAASVA